MCGGVLWDLTGKHYEKKQLIPGTELFITRARESYFCGRDKKLVYIQRLKDCAVLSSKWVIGITPSPSKAEESSPAEGRETTRGRDKECPL